LYADSDWSFKRKFTEKVKTVLGARTLTIPSKDHKMYAVDEWTGREMGKYYQLGVEDIYLYPVIRVDDFFIVEKKKKIAIFGRISPHKLIEDSIKIFAEGTKNNKDYGLVIFGAATADTSDYLNKLHKLIDSLELSDRVSIVQNPLFEDLKKILSETKIVIDSQREVSNTLTVIEAMAAGNIIIIHKNSGGYKEVLRNGSLGWGFESVEEGANALSGVLSRINEIKVDDSVERSKDFSEDKFISRLNEILVRH
jgi:glycosyltransferase involved in cell wall biosynthesis